MQINVKLSPDVLDWVMAHIQQENVPGCCKVFNNMEKW